MNKYFEATWIEIKNKKSKNILCGTIYRDPNIVANDHQVFLEYLDTVLVKTSKENKEIYISGDFNIDLLSIESNTQNKNFYDLMCSYGLLPKIIQPTTSTETTSTIIDNIFTNTFSARTISGNILTDFSDHLGNLYLLKGEKLIIKLSTCSKETIQTLAKKTL